VVVTAFTLTKDARLKATHDANSLGRRHLVMAWTLWAMCCVSVMFVLPGRETIPYHLGWAGFALAFGFGVWRKWQLLTSLAWYSLATGVALDRSWRLGRIAWDEIATELPLMFFLAMLLAWQVRRSRFAQAQMTGLAERDLQASRDRERFMQLTSHELRTPLTIAAGYIELLQARDMVVENQQDLSVVADELDRLSRVSDRLIRMMRLKHATTSEIVDFDQVMAQVVERWRVVADRCWTLDAGAGCARGSSERLRTCLDTLVENAIRYTGNGDAIRLIGSRQPHHVVVSVRDCGVGLTDHQIIEINAGEQLPLPGATARTVADTGTVDALAGTGLGLSIVRAAAHELGGTLHASHAPEGGAALTLTYPLSSPGEVGRFLPRLALGALPLRPGVAES
jgi:two-component system OmpR family sensor kinase